MAIQTINVGSSPNDSAGDPLRVAFQKCNANFAEVSGGGGSATLQTVTTAGNVTNIPIIFENAGLQSEIGNENGFFFFRNIDYIGWKTKFDNAAYTTTDRLVNFPDKDGVVAFISDIPTTATQVGALSIDGSIVGATSQAQAFGAGVQATNILNNNGQTAIFLEDQMYEFGDVLGGLNSTKISLRDDLQEIRLLAVNGATLNGNQILTVANTTANLADSTDKRYVTDAQLASIGVTSVQSVTGTAVNNTDPLNPIVNTPTATDIDALKRDGSNANSNINIGVNNIYADKGIFPSGVTANGNQVITVATGVVQGVDNATTLALTSAQLNSQYPSATTGFEVYCTGITLGKMTYKKTPSGWVGYTVLVP